MRLWCGNMTSAWKISIILRPFNFYLRNLPMRFVIVAQRGKLTRTQCTSVFMNLGVKSSLKKRELLKAMCKIKIYLIRHSCVFFRIPKIIYYYLRYIVILYYYYSAREKLSLGSTFWKKFLLEKLFSFTFKWSTLKENFPPFFICLKAHIILTNFWLFNQSLR